MGTEQTSIEFEKQFVEIAIPSGQDAGGALHYCNNADYTAALAKVNAIVAWCGAELVGKSVYPKDWRLVECRGCREKREEKQAAWSSEIWRRIDPGDVHEEEEEEEHE